MYELFLWLLPPFIIVLLAMKWITGWAARTMSRDIEAKMRAAEKLVNHHDMPDEWLAPHSLTLTNLQAHGAEEQQVMQAIESAKSDCLQRIDILIQFFKQGAFVESPQVRDTLVDALQFERNRMETQDWQAILESRVSKVHHSF